MKVGEKRWWQTFFFFCSQLMKKPTETKKQDADANNECSKHISSSSSEWPTIVTCVHPWAWTDSLGHRKPHIHQAHTRFWPMSTHSECPFPLYDGQLRETKAQNHSPFSESHPFGSQFRFSATKNLWDSTWWEKLSNFHLQAWKSLKFGAASFVPLQVGVPD